MNALAPRTDFNAAYLDAVIARYRNNDDTAAYEQALRNLNARQPAFWTTRSFNHVGANELRDRANNHVGIEAGIASIPECYAAVAEWIDLNTIAALDTLVPLNDEAVSDLMDAYEIAGTFRSPQELSDRRGAKRGAYRWRGGCPTRKLPHRGGIEMTHRDPAETMKSRPATRQEVMARFPHGTRHSYRHATYETARRHGGGWVTVHRNNSTGTVLHDEQGAYVMRKGQREDLGAWVTTYEGVAEPIIWGLASAYLFPAPVAEPAAEPLTILTPRLVSETKAGLTNVERASFDGIIERVRAAIAKAEGRS